MEQLTAVKRFPYAGKMLQPNDDFMAESKFAKVLIAIGKAKHRVADVEPKKKRAYKRRDLTAE